MKRRTNVISVTGLVLQLCIINYNTLVSLYRGETEREEEEEEEDRRSYILEGISTKKVGAISTNFHISTRINRAFCPHIYYLNLLLISLPFPSPPAPPAPCLSRSASNIVRYSIELPVAASSTLNLIIPVA